jgi:4-hydroxy-2-oxoglutarate aldolase
VSFPRITGVMPPMITPFLENGDVDLEGFAENVRKWNKTGLAGYLVNGSNSETAYLTEDEKIELLRLTVKNAGEGRHVMAGTGMESTRETIRFTNRCARLGAQSALVLTPCYYGSSMTSAALVEFFTRVADASEIPVLIYNVPKFTHVNIKADAVAALSKHPNIMGMKDSTGDVPQLTSFLNASAGQDFQIMVGTASAWYPALAIGIRAAILALANCHPDECDAVIKAFDAGSMERSREIYKTMFPVNTAVTATYGIAGLKAACDRKGYTGGFVRSPLLNSTPDERLAVEKIIADAERRLLATA